MVMMSFLNDKRSLSIFFTLILRGECYSYETTCTPSFRLVNKLIKYFIVIFLRLRTKPPGKMSMYFYAYFMEAYRGLMACARQ